jgi:hypothetical protein
VTSREARLSARFAFEKLQMQRVEIVVENAPSLRARPEKDCCATGSTTGGNRATP